MSKVTVVDNSNAVRAAIAGVRADVLGDVAAALEAEAKNVLQERIYSKPESPSYKRTNKLIENFNTRVEGSKALCTAEQEYAAYVELGSDRYNRPAIAFMKTALDREMERVPDRLSGKLRGALT